MPGQPFDFGQMYDDERSLPLDVSEYIKLRDRGERLIDFTDPEDGFMDVEEDFRAIAPSSCGFRLAAIGRVRPGNRRGFFIQIIYLTNPTL
jgi:hypothetical protein